MFLTSAAYDSLSISPASKIMTFTTSQTPNLTVIYETPSAPLDDRDYYDIYVLTLNLFK